MLEIGNGGMTDNEYRTHMTLWAITAAPLLAGNDLSKMTPAIKSILLNSEVIKVDQDKLGKQAVPVKHGNVETWVKPLADGGVAVAPVDLEADEAKATVKDTDLAMRARLRPRATSGPTVTWPSTMAPMLWPSRRMVPSCCESQTQQKPH